MKKIRKISVLICVLCCLFIMTACEDKKDVSENFKGSYSKEDLVEYMVNITETVTDTESEELDAIIETLDEEDESDTILINGIQSIVTAKKESGKYVGFYYNDEEEVKYNLTETKDSIVIKATAKFKKRDVKVEYSFGYIDDNLAVTGISYEPVYSIAEKMKTAGLNTIMGIVVVVLVLTFLSIVISLFKYINKAQTALAEKKNSKKESAMDSAFEQIESKEENITYSDDLEVVAVITAAIAAMENTSTDGFVVRSIKRVPGKKWNRGI